MIRLLPAFRTGLVFCCISVLAQAAPANRTSAQQVSPQGGSWIGVGAGLGNFAGTEGMAFQLQAAHHRDRHLLSIRATLVAEILGDEVYDIGVLYGRVWAKDRSFLTVGSGVGLVVTEECPGVFSGGTCHDQRTLGLPVSAEFSGRLTHFLGIGIQLFANINSAQSFFGGAFGVQVGSLGAA